MSESLNCEFCNEFERAGFSSFNTLYEGQCKSRIVVETASFRVVPTMGQLFENSMLILPKQHIETLAQLNESNLPELVSLYRSIKESLSEFGQVIAFEHGARKESMGSCGIYHAHLHVVPVPFEVNLFEFFDDDYKKSVSLESVLFSLSESQEYLLAINSDMGIGYIDLTKKSHVYSSQFFRRKLRDYFSLGVSWNWRDYNYVEEKLLRSVTSIQARRVVTHL
jgi:diadenosine tetraphosphate (Ap4A) HIT family hydrolase